MNIVGSILSKSITDTEDNRIYGAIGLFEFVFIPDEDEDGRFFWFEYELSDKDGNWYPYCQGYPITEEGINNALWEMICTLDKWCSKGGRRRVKSAFKAGFPH